MADRKGKRIDAYINDHEYRMMESFMIRNNYTIADVMREAVDEFLQNHDEKFYNQYVNNSGLKPGYYIKL